MSLLAIVLLSCVTMIAKDACATFMTVAEARGRAHLSGIINALGTPAGVLFMVVGANRMVNGHGWVGMLGLLPVMCVDYIDGAVFTKLANRIQPTVADSHHYSPWAADHGKGRGVLGGWKKRPPKGS